MSSRHHADSRRRASARNNGPIPPPRRVRPGPGRCAQPAGAAGKVLIVEDEVLTGLGMVAALETAGIGAMGPAASVKAAMDMLDRQPCVFAILDIALHDGETSAPLAERLRAAGIPFLIASTHSIKDQAPVFRGVPSLRKPVPARLILTAVREALP